MFLILVPDVLFTFLPLKFLYYNVTVYVSTLASVDYMQLIARFVSMSEMEKASFCRNCPLFYRTLRMFDFSFVP